MWWSLIIESFDKHQQGSDCPLSCDFTLDANNDQWIRVFRSIFGSRDAVGHHSETSSMQPKKSWFESTK